MVSNTDSKNVHNSRITVGKLVTAGEWWSGDAVMAKGKLNTQLTQQSTHRYCIWNTHYTILVAMDYGDMEYG